MGVYLQVTPCFELLRIDRAKVLGWNAIGEWLPDATLMQFFNGFNGERGHWGGKRNMVGG